METPVYIEPALWEPLPPINESEIGESAEILKEHVLHGDLPRYESSGSTETAHCGEFSYSRRVTEQDLDCQTLPYAGHEKELAAEHPNAHLEELPVNTDVNSPKVVGPEEVPADFKFDLEGGMKSLLQKVKGLTELTLDLQDAYWMKEVQAVMHELDDLEKALEAAKIHGLERVPENFQATLGGIKMDLSLFCSLGGASWEVTHERMAMLIADAEDLASK